MGLVSKLLKCEYCHRKTWGYLVPRICHECCAWADTQMESDKDVYQFLDQKMWAPLMSLLNCKNE